MNDFVNTTICSGEEQKRETAKELLDNRQAASGCEYWDSESNFCSLYRPSTERWIPFTQRELTAEEQEEHPEWCYIMEGPLPDDGQEILVSDGKWVWQDRFCVDDGCYLGMDGCAWMPLPLPYKKGE